MYVQAMVLLSLGWWRYVNVHVFISDVAALATIPSWLLGMAQGPFIVVAVVQATCPTVVTVCAL